MNKLQKTAPIIAALLFIALMAFTPLMHNHGPTLQEPLTCPVHLLDLTLISALSVLFMGALLFFLVVRYHSASFTTRLYVNFIYAILHNRAPPRS